MIEIEHRNCGMRSSKNTEQDNTIRKLNAEIQRLKRIERQHSNCEINLEAKIRLFQEKIEILEKEIFGLRKENDGYKLRLKGSLSPTTVEKGESDNS